MSPVQDFILYLFFSIVLPCSHAAISFPVTPVNVEAQIGDDVTFQCRIVTTDPGAHSWYHEEQPDHRPALVAQWFIVYRDNISPRMDTAGNYDITIKNVSTADVGRYYCGVGNYTTDHGDWGVNATLRIIGEPHFGSVTPSPKVIRVSTFSRFVHKLSCTVSGVPVPEVRWLKDGTNIQQNLTDWFGVRTTVTSDDYWAYNVRSELSFQGSERSTNYGASYRLGFPDIATYTCVASSDLFQDEQTRDIVVDINRPPTVWAASVNASNVHVLYNGTETHIVCHVDAKPGPTRVDWVNNGRPTGERQHRYIKLPLYRLPNSWTYRIDLWIRGVDYSIDTGNYQCVVTTPFGVHGASFKVVGAVEPDAPTNFTVTSIRGGWINTIWVAGFDGGYPQQFCLLVREAEVITRIVCGGNETWGDVFDLAPGRRYTASVFGRNEYGDGGESNSEDVLTPGGVLGCSADSCFRHLSAEQGTICQKVQAWVNCVHYNDITDCVPSANASLTSWMNTYMSDPYNCSVVPTNDTMSTETTTPSDFISVTPTIPIHISSPVSSVIRIMQTSVLDVATTPSAMLYSSISPTTMESTVVVDSSEEVSTIIVDADASIVVSSVLKSITSDLQTSIMTIVHPSVDLTTHLIEATMSMEQLSIAPSSMDYQTIHPSVDLTTPVIEATMSMEQLSIAPSSMDYRSIHPSVDLTTPVIETTMSMEQLSIVPSSMDYRSIHPTPTATLSSAYSSASPLSSIDYTPMQPTPTEFISSTPTSATSPPTGTETPNCSMVLQSSTFQWTARHCGVATVSYSLHSLVLMFITSHLLCIIVHF